MNHWVVVNGDIGVQINGMIIQGNNMHNSKNVVLWDSMCSNCGGCLSSSLLVGIMPKMRRWICLRQLLGMRASARTVASTTVAVRASPMSSLLVPGDALVAVDVGGANDLQPHWSRLVPISRFVVYEPHEASYRELLGRQADNPDYKNFRYLNEGLSGKGGPRTLLPDQRPNRKLAIATKKGWPR